MSKFVDSQGKTLSIGDSIAVAIKEYRTGARIIGCLTVTRFSKTGNVYYVNSDGIEGYAYARRVLKVQPANTLIVDKEYLSKLEDSVAFLQCLGHAGVDNWSGYSDAQEAFTELTGEDHE